MSMIDKPLPWRVEYNQRFNEWHPKSGPRVVDANGETVCEMPQSDNIRHPGQYDEVADLAAITIVDCVNNVHGPTRN